MISRRADGLVAGVQALLWTAPIIILITGGHGIPIPGSTNDPGHALAVIKTSPDIAIVTTVMCATAVLGLLVGVSGIAGTLVPAAGTACIALLLVWTLGFAAVLLTASDV